MAKKSLNSNITPKAFRLDEIEPAIVKLARRIGEVEKLLEDHVRYDDARVKMAESNIREAIREVFGSNSPEFDEHQYHDIGHGGGMIAIMGGNSEHLVQERFENGIPQTVTMLKGLIDRIKEKKQELTAMPIIQDEPSFWELIHPRIIGVSRSRFESKHYADSVEAAFKEINTVVASIVRKKTGEELDGAALMNRAFSLRNAVICLADLSTESGKNIQLGFMQIFFGSMTGIRNPKAHGNLTIDDKRAIHFLFLASLLMNKIDDGIGF
jgi:uncharacterized protein (TIGR02391 family)